MKIFYLQAEIDYHYLRERLQRLQMDKALLPLVRENLVITPQVRMLLDEKGIQKVHDTIGHFFKADEVDIIAIDPLRNVFDQGPHKGGENDNSAMLFFLQERVERLRNLTNPSAGIIIAHHTKKITKKMLEEDPFQSLSGASSLRGFYSSGIIMFRPDEKQSTRQLIFELRNGASLPEKWIDKREGAWGEVEYESVRLVNKDYGERLDAERRRRHDLILQIIYDEARKGNLYTSHLFCQKFENKGGLGGQHSIRDRIDVLATKGYIKFSKEGALRSKKGFMCVEGMEYPTGETTTDEKTGEIIALFRPFLPTHYKSDDEGILLPVEDPSVWIYHEEVLP